MRKRLYCTRTGINIALILAGTDTAGQAGKSTIGNARLRLPEPILS